MKISEEEWTRRQSIIDQWRSSKKTATAFCHEEHIPYQTFIHWRRSLRPASSNRFIQLKPATFHHEGYCELICADGKRLKFYSPPDATYLRTLLD